MRAAVARTLGRPDVVRVEEVPEPPLVPGSARVAVASAAVNFPDLLVLAGTYQAPVAPPFTPGCEFAGRVLEVADGVTSVVPGDLVLGLATHGAFAEQVVLDARRLTPVPPAAVDLGLDVLAAFGVTYTTAYHALRTFADVQPGEHVAVLGASGGVGLAAVDVARALGARPVAVGGDPGKLQACRELGAVATIDYLHEDLKLRLREVSGGGVDVVVDPVGGPFAEQALRAVRWGGRYVVVGFASGTIPRIPLNLVLLKGVHLTGFENRTILTDLPDVAPAHRAEVLDLLLTGQLHPHVGSTHRLDDVVEALREVEERRAVGKVVVRVADGV
ncbi:MAG: NADPH:quinone oxidoreductase family protein [Frankiales bacterium]|nr:NADPH:quinone oxidoreductase family protein [Frankiales bacterium]